MMDTEQEFRRKDAEYFGLLGCTVVVGNRSGVVTEYTPKPGPRYMFKVQFEPGGPEEFKLRDEFYVLPTHFEVAAKLHGEKHGDGCTFTNPGNCDRWHEALREAVAVLVLLGVGS